MSQGAKAVAGGQQVLVHAVHPGATIPGSAKGTAMAQQPSFLGSLFNKRERKLSHTEDPATMAAVTGTASQAQAVPYGRTTEV